MLCHLKVLFVGEQYNTVAVMVFAVNQDLARHTAQMPRTADFNSDERIVLRPVEMQSCGGF